MERRVDVLGTAWLRTMRAYFLHLMPLMLAWELAQLPLYTIWREGTAGEIAYAVAHCTGGDALIGLASLAVALLIFGGRDWPHTCFGPVMAVAVAIGVAVTVYLEWLNVEVRGAWAYAEEMPRIPPLGTGLSPVLQWLALPPLALLAARCRTIRTRTT